MTDPGIGQITSRIADNESGKVGLRVMGKVRGSPNVSIWPTSAPRGMVFLGGDRSNTFTGDVEVSDSNILLLNKSFGATAIRGNITVRRGSGLVFWQSNQLADTATVTLDGREHLSGLSFEAKNYTMTESFHRLVVKGEGLLYFYQKPTYRTLFLDDLQIESGGLLRVADWTDGVTKLLVRKDSEHLDESLSRIRFDGYAPARISLVEHDANYWEVSALPLPTNNLVRVYS